MEENNENVVEQVEETVEQPQQEEQAVDETKFDSAGDESVIKIDLSKPIENENQEETTKVTDGATDDAGVVGSDESAATSEEQEEVPQEAEAQEQSVVEEITDEPIEQEEVVENPAELEVGINESGNLQVKVPGNLEKLVDFMEETGGSLEDYVRLNQDYSEIDNDTVLREYYKKTKPHLNGEEVSFLMEDQFSFDEEVDDDREIRRKKLALKEQVADARSFLDGQKSKYYEEIKNGSKLTKEQQEAISFFNDYNAKSEQTKTLTNKQKSVFKQKTENVFNDKFKGFEYNVGDKKYRFNVNDVNAVKQNQGDINNFLGKFLGKDGTIDNATGYHKSIFTAMNADAIAKHFYEQGKADAVKDSVNKAKNIDMEPRSTHKEFGDGEVKFRVLGDNSSDFKFKIKKK
tara:strand:- start:14090 stop:15301 length:1212 start_codon:yes stop_codon:yes gene_type:complete